LTGKGIFHIFCEELTPVFINMFLSHIMEEKMRIRKIIGMSIFCLAIAGLAMAQPQGQSAPGGAAPGGAAGGAPQGEQAAATLDMTPVYEAMDINKDGKVNKEEWLGSGMDQDSYDNLFVNMLDKDKDGNLTKEDIMAAIPRFEVDSNKDGKASIEEFAKANKDAAASMKSGGQGAASGGAAGGAPGAAPGGAPAGAPAQK
jgi:hypothetical protein